VEQLKTETTTGLGTKSYTHEKGRLIREKDYNGYITESGYDMYGNVNEVRFCGKDNENTGKENVTRYVYDEVGNLTQKMESNGKTTEYTYDECGNCLSETTDRGIIYYAYTDAGLLKSVKDVLGRETKYTYDEYDAKLTRVDYPDKTFETYRYDECGNVLEHIDRQGIEQTYKYNWSRLSNNVKFYFNGSEVMPPWIH